MAHRFHGDPSRLDNEERRLALPALPLLRQLGVTKGQHVIDFGAGIGYFTIPLLDLVGPTGSVVAIDSSSDMLAELRKRAGDPPNLTVVQAESLGDACGDLVLLAFVLHELDGPHDFLQECFAHLNAHGRVVVVDWQKHETQGRGPPVEHRLAKEEVLAMTSHHARDLPIHKFFYCLVFES